MNRLPQFVLLLKGIAFVCERLKIRWGKGTSASTMSGMIGAWQALVCAICGMLLDHGEINKIMKN